MTDRPYRDGEHRLVRKDNTCPATSPADHELDSISRLFRFVATPGGIMKLFDEVCHVL